MNIMRSISKETIQYTHSTLAYLVSDNAAVGMTLIGGGKGYTSLDIRAETKKNRWLCIQQGIKEKKAQWVGFEPTRGDPN